MSYPADLYPPESANHKNIREPLGPKTHKIFQGNSPGRRFQRILYLFKELYLFLILLFQKCNFLVIFPREQVKIKLFCFV